MEYFAGANTYRGFRSMFEAVFGAADRLFIIKGSSGCGKSTLMKRLAERAESKGLECDRIHCSADTYSLDGIIIPSLSVAVADGTAPHLLDVRYPCVRESIINLGMFWDDRALLPRRDEIISLTDRKSKCFARAYDCLGAAGKISESLDSRAAEYLDRAKLNRYAERLVSRLCGTKGVQRRLITSAFTLHGTETLPSFGNVKKVCLVDTKHGFARELLTLCADIAKVKGLRSDISMSELDITSPDAVFFPNEKVLICEKTKRPFSGCETEKHISCDRFYDERISAGKIRERAVSKLEAGLLAEAEKHLADASEIHGEIERIYIRSMDFASLDAYTLSLSERIFG